MLSVYDRVTRRLGKIIYPNFGKSGQNSCQAKNVKYLRQNSIWKPKASSSDHFWDIKICTYFETDYWGENVKKMLSQKVAQNFAILGLLIFSKSHNGHAKVAQWEAINHKQITRWQHVSQLKASSFGSW